LEAVLLKTSTELEVAAYLSQSATSTLDGHASLRDRQRDGGELMEPDADVDAMVADAVRSVRDRFGADGLRDLVVLASAEIQSSERAVADLGEMDAPVSQAGSGPDAADTQAWLAYTAQETEQDADTE
jgi:hypothetical protein